MLLMNQKVSTTHPRSEIWEMGKTVSPKCTLTVSANIIETELHTLYMKVCKNKVSFGLIQVTAKVEPFLGHSTHCHPRT